MLEMSEQDSDLSFLCMESGLFHGAEMLAESHRDAPFLNGAFWSWHVCSSPKVSAVLLGGPGHVHMSINAGANGFVPTLFT